MGDLDGVVRQRRRLLPLFVLGRPWLRPHRPGRYLRPRLSSNGRGAALRHHPAAEQDLADEHDRALMATKIETLAAALPVALGESLQSVTTALGVVTAIMAPEGLVEAMRRLRDRPELRFEILVDVCGVDYSAYGATRPDVDYFSSDATPA